MTVMTSDKFLRDAALADQEAAQGPVFIMDGGRTARVLLSAEDYERLLRHGPTIGELLASPETADVEIDFPRFKDLPREVGFD